MKKEYHIISHTHWDREWYQSFELMRLRLLDLVDHLLDIFDKHPDYIFHMDAQVICLEDYLEIRPHRRDEILKRIREKRLLAGPWYVQNDFNLCSGEATVRNLLIGQSIAEEWGNCDYIGYAPDQFGLNAQLPQIYSGFGIRHSVASRGYRFFEKAEDGGFRQKKIPMEFDWVGADGTRINAVNLSCWYNNAQRFPPDEDKAVKYFNLIADIMETASIAPFKLLLNGVDHLEPQPDLLPVLDKIRRRLGDDVIIKQSTFKECLEKIDSFFTGKDKPEYHGELRQGETPLILAGTLSSRPYLKRLNMDCQNLLELQLEPLYTHLNLWSNGAVEYPADILNYLWKELLKNHAHDSICGCGSDRVHQDNENRFYRILDSAEDLRRRGLNHLIQRIDRTGMDLDGYLLTVVNTLPYNRTETVDAIVYPLTGDGFKQFELIDEDGRRVEYQLLDFETANRCFITPYNLPGQKLTDRSRIRFQITMPACGYRTLQLRRATGDAVAAQKPPAEKILQNKFLKVTICENGQVNLLDYESGKEIQNLFSFEDVSDIGESYWFTPGTEPAPIDVHTPPVISSAGDSSIRFEYSFGVTLNLSLPETGRSLKIDAVVNNQTKNHRLRLLVHTDINSAENISSQPFDCIRRKRDMEFPELRNDWTEPTNGLVSLTDGSRQISIFHNGLYEYEHLRDSRGTIALTLMRSTARIANDPMCCGDANAPDPLWDAPENQCLRTVEYRLAIRPGISGDAQLMQEMQCFQVPLQTVFDAVDSRKFSTGRPYVCEDLMECFHRLPAQEERNFPRRREGLTVSGNVVFSACKQSHDRHAWILRLFNPSDENTFAKLKFIDAGIPLQQAELNEVSRGNSVEPEFSVAAKKIITLRSM